LQWIRPIEEHIRVRRLLRFLLPAFILLTAIASAQSVDVTVKGIVIDQTGAVLPGVIVTATNSQTRLVRSATTDSEGLYGLPPIPPGIYEVKAELAGFRPQIRANQNLHVGTTIRIDFRFDTLTAAEVVDVVASAPMLETTKNTLSRLVERAEIDALPVVDRNFNALAALVPGVTATGAYGGVDISGSRDFQNGYNVDGVSAEGLALGEQRVWLAQDWIHEFQVLTNQYNVEFGRASGGIVNAITRSGTNAPTTRLYGFFRNEAWDATPAFVDAKAPLDIKRLGATSGGRIVPNRLFYFGGFEWFDNASSTIVNSSFPAENGAVSFATREELYLGKFDFHPQPSSTYRFRFNGQRNRSTNAGVGGIATEEFGGPFRIFGYDLIGSSMHTLSAKVFNEGRVAFNDHTRSNHCNYGARHPSATWWFERRYPGARFGCPPVGGTTITEMQIIDNVSWTWGRHDLKAGVETSRARNSGTIRRDGLYRFASDIPFDINNPASFPVSFATFIGPSAWDYSWWSVGGFVQDSWRLRPDVTLNIGVRYDLDGSYTALNRMLPTGRGLTPVARDENNIGPRVGVAWQPFGSERGVLVRGGAGLYHDQNHANIATLMLQNNILVERQVTITATDPGLNPFWPDIGRARRFLAEGLAQDAIPDLGSLRTVSGASNLDQALQIPATVQASVGAAADFGEGLRASADLVYSRGIDQYIIRDVNVDRTAALEAGRIVRPNPNYSFLNSYGNDGSFTYRALQLQASYAPNPAHMAKLSYTLAKNVGNTNTILSGIGGGVGATNPFDFAEDEGPTDNHVRHALSVNGVTTLPFDVQLSGILTYRSALPYSVTTSQQLDSDPFPDRPEPRNSRRGDEFFSLDARVSKVARFNARRSVTGFVEVFNITNATNLIRYVGVLGSGLFGQPTAALEKRRAQLGLRLDF
jgi:hypothetical protein